MKDQSKVANCFLEHCLSVAIDIIIGKPVLVAMNGEHLKCHPRVQTILNNIKIVKGHGQQFDIVKLNCAEVQKA